MNLTAYRLSFPGPVHISDARGDYGKGEKIIHSDTFYAALLAASALTQATVDADLDCTISSLFPFTKAKDKVVYFFPKPLLQLQQFTDYDDVKKLKRIEWMDKVYFEQLLQGKITSPINQATIKGSFLTALEIDKAFTFTQTIPRVAIPRSANDNNGQTNIYYIERTYFKEDSGLYFLAFGDTSKLERALNILQHEGIGTDRNVGFGYFKIFKDSNFSLSLPRSSDFSVSLSLLNTDEQEKIEEITKKERAAWEVIRRGGWVTSQGNNGIRKRSVYMFTEGSIFYCPSTGITTLGKHNLNLSPPAISGFEPPKHEIWRSGRAIILPINLHER